MGCKWKAAARRNRERRNKRNREKRAKELGLTYEQFEAQGFRKKPKGGPYYIPKKDPSKSVWALSGIEKPPKEASKKEKWKARSLALRTIRYNKIKKFFEDNKDQIAPGLILLREAELAKNAARLRKRYWKNLDEERARRREYNNRPSSKVRSKELQRKTQAEHPEKHRAARSRRRGRQANAVLPTTDEGKILELQRIAAQRTKDTGIPHVVDHTKPVILGGAHHQDNMEVTTEDENLRKGGKYYPELGGLWADNDAARETQRMLAHFANKFGLSSIKYLEKTRRKVKGKNIYFFRVQLKG